MEVELGPVEVRAALPQAAHGLDEAAREVRVQLHVALGFLGSSSLRARAPGVAGHAMGPRPLASRCSLEAEVVEVLHGPRRRWPAEGEVERGTVRGSPLRCG